MIYIFYKRQPHLGRSKAVVRVARLLLVAVWHILTAEVADRASARNTRDIPRSASLKVGPPGVMPTRAA